MNKILKFALAGFFAMALSVLAVGQVAFNEVKATSANGNSATGLNNSSQALANSGTITSPDVAIWTRTGGFKSIGMSSKTSTASAINTNGVVAGSSNVSGLSQAFLWKPNVGADWLGSLGSGMSIATALNDSNAVVGLSYNAANQQHAFLWTAGGGMQDLTPDLTSIGGATATGVNASGEVVGYYFPNGSRWSMGFTWTASSGLQGFGPFGTIALAMNNSGTAVGQFTNGAGYKHAFQWTQSGGITDLGTLGGSSSIAYSVNKNGWVVGTSVTADGTGVLHPFLWTPTGGMQDLRTLAGLSKSIQPDSIQVNDYGVVAMSTNKGLELLSPMMYATMTSSPNPSVAGQPVTFTLTLSSIAGPPPDGELVKFTVTGVYYGSAVLSGGVAQFTTSTIPSGLHTVVAKYVGDANYLPNKYSAVQQQVNP